ncbi:hypothetical protein GCM10023115_09710 [Pontixanthobacter gangjinensis]
MAEVASELWRRQAFDFSIARGEVDDGGYDVIIEVGKVVRHIQLKAKHVKGRTTRYGIQIALTERTSGCVIVMVHDPKTLLIDRFHFLGGGPGKPLGELGDQPVKHTKGDADGVKAVRPGLRSVPLSKFTLVDDVSQLVEHLFGDETNRVALEHI